MAANIVRRKAKDGRIVLFDADTKQSLGYEEAPVPQQSPEVSDDPAEDSFSDKLNTILQHGAQGAAVGFGDELAGLTEAAGQAVGLEGTGGPIKDIGISKAGPSLDLERLKQAYERGKARQLEIFEQTAQENPELALAADIAGGVLSPISKVGAVGSAAAKLAPIIGKAAPLAKYAPQIAEGAVLGAIEGAGRADTDNASTGGIIGGVLGGAGGAIAGKLGKLFQKSSLEDIAKSTKKDAAIDALAAIGGTKKVFEKEFGNYSADHVKGIGEELLKRDIVKFKGNYEDTVRAIDSAISENNNVLQNITSTIAKKWKPDYADFEDLGGHIEGFINKFAKDRSYGDNIKSVMSKTSELVDRVATDLTKAFESGDFNELIAIKQRLGKELADGDWSTRSDGLSPLKNIYKEYYNLLKEFTENQATKINPNLGSSFKEINKSTSNLIDAKLAAQAKRAADAPKTAMGLLDWAFLTGGTFAGGGNPLAGIAALGAKKSIEHSLGKDTRGILRTAGALSKQKTAKGLQKLADSPEALQSIQDVLQKVPGKAPLVGGALTPTESPETVSEPFNESLSNRLRSGSSDDLLRDAASLEQNFGESGAMFAEDLRKVAQGSKFERTTTAFKLMSNPAFKEMMRELKIRE